eukprot:GHVT01029361.1.p1 GENE.GHVT01029361.1~~GHVT01029361.1.p1  ORF type:complete len:106 (-),score=19.92 GHVT01029361.1:86-403(-)
MNSSSYSNGMPEFGFVKIMGPRYSLLSPPLTPSLTLASSIPLTSIPLSSIPLSSLPLSFLLPPSFLPLPSLFSSPSLLPLPSLLPPFLRQRCALVQKMYREYLVA